MLLLTLMIFVKGTGFFLETLRQLLQRTDAPRRKNDILSSHFQT